MINYAYPYVGIQKQGLNNLMDFYNQNCVKFVKPSRKYRMKVGDNWCAMFTSVIAFMAGKSPDKFPYEVSVMEQYKLAVERGLFYKDLANVREGDLVLYSWKVNGHLDHVGMVVRLANGVLTVLEGNKNNTVGYRDISPTSKFIYGFIRV